jgi:hypothetical protein
MWMVLMDGITELLLYVWLFVRVYMLDAAAHKKANQQAGVFLALFNNTNILYYD